MVLTEHLNDAAIALHQVLTHARISFGIFGGYAVGSLGGPRESKDIDCLAALNKKTVLGLLDGKHGFRAVNPLGDRQDYVAFIWTHPVKDPQKKASVLVEIFCEQFPGAQYGMSSVRLAQVSVKGRHNGEGVSLFLDPFFVFKGKLRAAATRDKFHDSADLRFLVGSHAEVIKARAKELNLEYVGLAIKRYGVLERTFKSLGVDVEAAKKLTENVNLNGLPNPGIGDVQKGILRPR